MIILHFTQVKELSAGENLGGEEPLKFKQPAELSIQPKKDPTLITYNSTGEADPNGFCTYEQKLTRVSVGCTCVRLPTG